VHQSHSECCLHSVGWSALLCSVAWGVGRGAVAFRSGGGGGRQVVATDVGVVVSGKRGGAWMPQTNRQKIRVWWPNR